MDFCMLSSSRYLHNIDILGYKPIKHKTFEKSRNLLILMLHISWILELHYENSNWCSNAGLNWIIYMNYMKPVSKIDKPISALRYRCLNTVLQVEIYIYIVNISTCSLFMLDMYQINWCFTITCVSQFKKQMLTDTDVNMSSSWFRL